MNYIKTTNPDNGKTEYHLIHNGETIGKYEKIAFFYTYDKDGGPIRGTLQKHGNPQLVLRDFQVFKAFNAKMNHKFGEVILVQDEDFDVEELNKMINTTGYVGIWHENQKEDLSVVLEFNLEDK